MNMRLLLITVITLTACSNEQISFSPAKSQRYQPTLEELRQLNRLVELTYSVGEFEDQIIRQQSQLEDLSKTITFDRPSPILQQWKQISRPWKQASIEQGRLGLSTTENFPSMIGGTLDLLIVMDNSGSMTHAQTEVAKRLNSLLSKLGTIDWQIAVTTTDPTRGSCLTQTPEGKRTLSKADFEENPERAIQVYQKLIKVGTDGATNERGIKAATEAAVGNCGNPDDDWKRPGSDLAVLIISDEKHCGSHPSENCIGEDWNSKNYFLDAQARPLDKTTVFGLFLLKNIDVGSDPLCPESGGWNDYWPSEYIDLVEETGGIAAEICQEDYTDVFERISEKVADRVSTKFRVSEDPIPGTVQVKLGSQILPFKRDGKNISIDHTEANGNERVSISYRYGQSSMKDGFKIPPNIDESSIQIFLNSNPTSLNYNYDSVSGDITFSSLPPEESKITIKYKDLINLPRTFPLPKDFSKVDLAISINEQFVDPTEYSIEESFIIFKAHPPEGSSIQLTYTPDTLKTSYNLDGIPWNKVSNIEALDMETGESVPMVVKGPSLLFPPEEIISGREIEITFKLEYSDQDLRYSYPIQRKIWQDRVEVDTYGSDSICTSSLEATSKIEVSCNDHRFSQFIVRYKALKKIHKKFYVGEEQSRDRVLTVRVDGISVPNYRWDGKWVLLDSLNESHAESVVTISISPDPSLASLK